jgi:hypothetical protein
VDGSSHLHRVLADQPRTPGPPHLRVTLAGKDSREGAKKAKSAKSRTQALDGCLVTKAEGRTTVES